jgi:hypothetical protein
MERKLKLFVVFFTAFILGLTAYGFGQLVFFGWEEEARRASAPASQTEQPALLTEASAFETKREEFVAEFRGVSVDSLFPVKDYNTKLLDEPNSDFFSEDIVTKPGEAWLAAEQRRNGEIVLTSSRLKVKKHPDDGFTVSVSFDKVSDPIFAVKDLKNVRAGKIKTIYLNRLTASAYSDYAIRRMTSDFRQVFELNGKNYYLRVATGTDEDGQRVGLLVLGDGKTEQVIDYSPYWDDIELHLGTLVWAGDMDNDGKLDLYIDRSYTEEKSGTGLFLSSHATSGKLVKMAALFAHAGC